MEGSGCRVGPNQVRAKWERMIEDGYAIGSMRDRKLNAQTISVRVHRARIMQPRAPDPFAVALRVVEAWRTIDADA